MVIFKLNRDQIIPGDRLQKEEILEIQLQLFSILREKLPPEKKGKTTLHLNEGTTVADLLRKLDINRRVAFSVNGNQESDGDAVKIFTSVGGG